MRRTLTSVLAGLALAGAAVAAPPSGAPAAAPAPLRPRTLAGLRAAAVREEERLLALVTDAAMDSSLRRVRTFAAYPEAVLSTARREATGGVTVLELFEIASDERVPPEVREEAVGALLAERVLKLDPELSEEGRKSARPRARFSLRVVKALSDPDLVTRSLANKVLLGLWPLAHEAEIKAFDPRKRETWGNARAAWTRYLGA